MAIEIFWASGSPFSWRVLLAAEVKGVAYDSRLVSFDKGEHKTPEYRKLNPRGRTPLLRDGDFVLTESVALMVYLDRIGSGPSLFGASPRESARVFEALSEITSDFERAAFTFAEPIIAATPATRPLVKEPARFHAELAHLRRSSPATTTSPAPPSPPIASPPSPASRARTAAGPPGLDLQPSAARHHPQIARGRNARAAGYAGYPATGKRGIVSAFLRQARADFRAMAHRGAKPLRLALLSAAAARRGGAAAASRTSGQMRKCAARYGRGRRSQWRLRRKGVGAGGSGPKRSPGYRPRPIPPHSEEIGCRAPGRDSHDCRRTPRSITAHSRGRRRTARSARADGGSPHGAASSRVRFLRREARRMVGTMGRFTHLPIEVGQCASANAPWRAIGEESAKQSGKERPSPPEEGVPTSRVAIGPQKSGGSFADHRSGPDPLSPPHFGGRRSCQWREACTASWVCTVLQIDRHTWWTSAFARQVSHRRGTCR